MTRLNIEKINLTFLQERKVIRFRKSSPNKETISSDGGRSRTTREVDFLKYVISGFLGDYIQPPEALRVTREEMIRINEAVRPVRPGEETLSLIYRFGIDVAIFLLSQSIDCPKKSSRSTPLCSQITHFCVKKHLRLCAGQLSASR